MKFSVASKSVSADSLFVFVPEKKWNAKLYGTFLSSSLAKQIAERMSAKDCEGKLGEMVQLFPGSNDAKKTFLIGTGKGDQLVDQRKAASLALRKAKKLKSKKVAFLLPDIFDLKRIVSGAMLGNYEFKIGDTKDQFSPSQVTLLSRTKFSQQELDAEVALGEATNFTRDLINLPPNMMTPKILAGKAKTLTKINKSLKVKVLGEKELLKLKMGNFYAVGQGSAEESQMVVLEYNGGKKSDKPIAFVGKGVTFDAGGYNLKPTKYIETMKCDMGGAATVLGLFHWIAKAKPKQNVIGVIGAVENLVSSNAFKPGDILTGMNGQTVEITNTDAEGRLVLSDCLYYAATKLKPRLMMDAATLTGAVVVALGEKITGIMGNDAKAITQVKKAAEQADEPVWELPITDFFREKIKGTQSDLINWTAGVGAGSSMAGTFLENFVEKTPWVHFDIAGTAFHEKGGDELSPIGATGTLLRTWRNVVESV